MRVHAPSRWLVAAAIAAATVSAPHTSAQVAPPTKPGRAPVPATTSPQPPADTKLRDELRAAQGQFTGPMTLTYAGTYEMEAHLSRPHQTMKVACRLVVSIRDEVITWDSYMGPEGATGSGLHNRERGILTSWGSYTMMRGKWEPAVAHDSIAVMHTIGAIMPALIVRGTIDPVAVQGRSDLVSTKTMGGHPLLLRIDPETKLVLGAEWPRAHRRLGDISDTIAFTGFEVRSGVQVPKAIDAVAYEDSSNYRMQMTLQPEQPAIDEEAMQAALTLVPPVYIEPTVDTEMIAPDLWSFRHNESDARSLVMDTDLGLLIFEAPLASPIGEQMIDAIRARLPNKTMRAVVVSHYHPHYTGGIRAFVAAGCDIYTTAGVAPLLQELLDRPFTRQPDRQQTARRVPKINLINGRQELNDSKSAVTILDIGKDSQHTDEYLIFYFPKQKILFEGDLGYFQPSGTLRIMPTSKGLIKAVKEQGWDVETLVQSWPGHDTPPLAWTTFLEAVDKIERALKNPPTTAPAQPATSPPAQPTTPPPAQPAPK